MMFCYSRSDASSGRKANHGFIFALILIRHSYLYYNNNSTLTRQTYFHGGDVFLLAYLTSMGWVSSVSAL